MSHVCIINGNPDPSPERFAAAIAQAYAAGAVEGGHSVSCIDVGALEFGFVRGKAMFDTPPEGDVAVEREKIAAADHVVIIYPMWLGTMPAMLKAFLEEAARGGFFVQPTPDNEGWPVKVMAGKSARVIVTMGMPGFLYRVMFRAHSLKSLEGLILRLSGFKPVRSTVFGSVEEQNPARRETFLKAVHALGREAR